MTVWPRLVLIALALASIRPALAAAPRVAPFDAPFAMPEWELPRFPDQDFSVADFGARGDGHLDTAAIQRAIDACGAAGGGRVRVPPGRWLTGPLTLRSRVNLHVEEGARLVFTDEKQFYFGPAAPASIEGRSQFSASTSGARAVLYPPALIQAVDCENIAVTGPGTIDGQGMGWWPLHRTWWERAKQEKPEAAAAEKHAWRGLDPGTSPQRPPLLQPFRCRGVFLEGFTAVDSPFWTINPVDCENVIIRGLTIRAAWPGAAPHAPNTDGINPESCRNVLIEDCDIRTGDDSIAIKSGLDAAGRNRGLPAENVVIRRIRANRIAIGSEMSGGVRNVLIRDCQLGPTGAVFSIKTRRGRGGLVENIWIEDLATTGVTGPCIRVEMEYWTQVQPAPPEPVSERTPPGPQSFFPPHSGRS